MNIDGWRVVSAGLLYLFIVLSGLRLSRGGRPLNAGILAFHKLVSLATLVLLVVLVLQTNRASALGPSEWFVSALTGAAFVDTIGTGGWLSMEKPAPPVIRKLHQITSVLTVLLTAATLYLLLYRV